MISCLILAWTKPKLFNKSDWNREKENNTNWEGYIVLRDQRKELSNNNLKPMPWYPKLKIFP